jgi:hypothetical protein
VQQQILASNPSADLRAYTVWFNMLFGDSRQRWDGAGMTDPRVQHFWDEQKVVGTWYTANVTHARGTTWDFFAVYGPDARDLSAPLSTGSTIIGHRTQLQASLAPLLGTRPPS